VKEVKRSFVFLNLAGQASPAALIVFDKVVASNPAFKKYWLLHSMEEPEVRGNATTIAHGGRMINTTLLPEGDNLEIAKVGGPGKEFWVFGENFPNEPEAGADPKEFEIGAWRTEVSPRKASGTDYFLNVMQMTGGSAGTVEKLTAAEMTGVRVADRVVWFQTSGERTERGVAFTVAGDGTIKYLVTDLAAGTWQVWRDGKIVRPAVRVAESEGTLYFEGPAGKYELRR
jgi:heparin/heparan-sulfate lyase